MKISRLFGNERQRRFSFAALAVVAAGGVVLSWKAGGPAAAVAAGLLSLIIAILYKAVVELTVEVRNAAVIRSQLESQGALLTATRNEMRELDRRRTAFGEKVLDRVRTVEAATGSQHAINDRVLDRIRVVEASTGNQTHTNDRIIERVRSVEAASTVQKRFADEMTERVARAEQTSAALLEELERILLSRNQQVREHLELRLAPAVARLRATMGR